MSNNSFSCVFLMKKYLKFTCLILNREILWRLFVHRGHKDMLKQLEVKIKNDFSQFFGAIFTQKIKPNC